MAALANRKPVAQGRAHMQVDIVGRIRSLQLVWQQFQTG